MIRVAFTLIGGKSWTGGFNYLVNLLTALCKHQANAIRPVLFLGTDVPDDEVAPLLVIQGTEIVRDAAFSGSRKPTSLARSVVLGVDSAVKHALLTRRIDVVFESAVFFGWRLGLPAVAWFPDLQHRELRHLFSRMGYWKRELGFRAQIRSGRTVMVSSDDTRILCESAYPGCRGHIEVVHFAMPPSLRPLSDIDARSVADTYGLPERYFYLPNQFWRHKNHALVLQALSLLRQRGLPVVVAASGKQSDPRDPTHFPRIVALIQSLRLQDDFRLLGLVPYDHLGALMQASVALLNPSTFEGWSTTVEEARTLGVPMILSDLKVHREQACGDAVYFDRNSAEALAAVLAAASLSAPPRLTDGCAGAEQRVAGFARRFTEVARSAMSDRVEVRARG